MPGILNEGLDNMRAFDGIWQPSSSRTPPRSWRPWAAPSGASSRRGVDWDLEEEVSKDELYRTFNEWCLDQGTMFKGGKEHFMRELTLGREGSKAEGGEKA